jgi:hypothetical protein
LLENYLIYYLEILKTTCQYNCLNAIYKQPKRLQNTSNKLYKIFSFKIKTNLSKNNLYHKGLKALIIALFVAFFPTLIEQLHILKCAFSAIRSLQTLEK